VRWSRSYGLLVRRLVWCNFQRLGYKLHRGDSAVWIFTERRNSAFFLGILFCECDFVFRRKSLNGHANRRDWRRGHDGPKCVTPDLELLLRVVDAQQSHPDKGDECCACDHRHPRQKRSVDNIAKADKRSRSFLVQQIVEEWLRDHAVKAAKPRKLKKPRSSG
jgi:hypothetical protein